MTKAITNSFIIAKENIRLINKILTILCIIMIFGYAFNIYRTISHTVALQSVTKEKNKTEVIIQDLDTKYLAEYAKITPEFLINYGFISSNSKTFITRTSSLGLVSLLGNEF